MKKCLIVVLSLLLLLTACGKKQTAPTWQEQYDLGVRYLSEGKYEEAIIAFEAAIEIDPKRKEAYTSLAEVYTAQGDTAKAEEVLVQMRKTLEITEERIDNEDGSYSIAEYNAEGKKAKTTYYNADGSVEDYYICEYAANGNRVKLTWYNADGSVRSVTEYDANGNMVKSTYYSADGSKHVSEYDANDNKVKETMYNADGSVDYYWTSEYDANGNKVKETQYNADGSVDHYETYEYAGNQVEVSFVWREETVSWSTNYTMASPDHKAKIWGWGRSGDSVRYIKIRETDSSGNEIAVTKFDNNGNIIEE